MSEQNVPRRRFLGGLASLGAAGLVADAQSTPAGATADGNGENEYRLPEYACVQDYRSLKQSSYDRTGGNGDAWPIEAGGTN